MDMIDRLLDRHQRHGRPHRERPTLQTIPGGTGIALLALLAVFTAVAVAAILTILLPSLLPTLVGGGNSGGLVGDVAAALRALVGIWIGGE